MKIRRSDGDATGYSTENVSIPGRKGDNPDTAAYGCHLCEGRWRWRSGVQGGITSGEGRFRQ